MAEILSKAKPIFLRGLEKTLNIQAGFRRDFFLAGVPCSAQIHLTARSFYRLYCNGQLVMHGPARTAHGCLRADVVDITAFLQPGVNRLAVEVTASVGCLGGYSNDCTAESSLLLAALVTDGTTLLVSDEEWDAVRLTQREEFSEKISHCRQNTEIYHLDEAYTAWRTAEPHEACVQCLTWQKAAVCPIAMPRLLPRRMLLPTLNKKNGARLVQAADARIDLARPYRAAWFEGMYAEYYARISEHPLKDYVQTVESPLTSKAAWLQDGVAFTERRPDTQTCAIFDFGTLQLGFLGFTVTCRQPMLLDVIHLEFYNEKEDKNGCIGNTNPVTRLYLPAGTTRFLSMEPALVRHLKFYFRGLGDCSVQDIHVREYCYPDEGHGAFQCSDDDINRLYGAARKTLLYNTLDIFMDCPERERGGWLCDSLWTARSAALLLGDLSVEKAFLENFLLAPYGDGVGAANNFFPEVYPGNKLPGAPAITTWSFWLMLELVEYVERSGDLELALQYETRVADFVQGTQRYLGACGLLENMPFVFVDWSQSNNAANTAPVSTAANALYAFMLKRLGQLYHRKEWSEAGQTVRALLRKALLQRDENDFMDKRFFPDSLHVDEKGQLQWNEVYSEACQYTILWAELFEKEEIPLIVRSVVQAMGPAPQLPTNPLIGRSGLFIGLCIRLDLLAKWKESETLLRELRAIYLPQLTEGPGTLWESQELTNSSRCHGFTSHAAVHLMRDHLGLGIPQVFDLDSRTALSPTQQRALMQQPAHLCGLRWMRGTVSTQNGIVSREVFE